MGGHIAGMGIEEVYTGFLVERPEERKQFGRRIYMGG
jgi:hypothetical protein